MAATIFHWGLHPWAIYAIVALALALFSFNKGLPLSIRSIFYPILGERVWGWPGHIVDILAVFATIFGLATSLGFGAEQADHDLPVGERGVVVGNLSETGGFGNLGFQHCLRNRCIHGRGPDRTLKRRP